MERLQKYMARCGVASRRKCEEIILSRRVKVNGNVIFELGTKIDELEDIVSIDDIEIKLEEIKRYIALNKPVGYISSVSDERGRKTILDLVSIEERVYPIGRLDYDSCGLIILTNDGDVYNKVIHPRENIDKKYYFEIREVLSFENIIFLEKGVDIGGYITKPCKIMPINEGKEKGYYIVIHEGKNRQIRKMLKTLGYDIIHLERKQIGDIHLGKLKRGEYRELNGVEINYLKSL